MTDFGLFCNLSWIAEKPAWFECHILAYFCNFSWIAVNLLGLVTIGLFCNLSSIAEKPAWFWVTYFGLFLWFFVNFRKKPAWFWITDFGLLQFFVNCWWIHFGLFLQYFVNCRKTCLILNISFRAVSNYFFVNCRKICFVSRFWPVQYSWIAKKLVILVINFWRLQAMYQLWNQMKLLQLIYLYLLKYQYIYAPNWSTQHFQ